MYNHDNSICIPVTYAKGILKDKLIETIRKNNRFLTYIYRTGMSCCVNDVMSCKAGRFLLFFCQDNILKEYITLCTNSGTNLYHKAPS